MSSPVARILPDGQRLHLQHGPIDLIIGVDGDRAAGFAAARARFTTLLDELVSELDLLRTPVGPSSARPGGETARRMAKAARAHLPAFITPMVAVAGAVAETILAAMLETAELRRAYVNNGGDIAIWLAPGQHFDIGLSALTGGGLGRVRIGHDDPFRGIATSGRGGRSLSLGIADSVTVLAPGAADADAAATMIANAVDLPGHPAIRRVPARDIRPESDLADLPVVRSVGHLTADEYARALEAGLVAARRLERAGTIHAAALFLGGQAKTCGAHNLLEKNEIKAVEYA